MTPYLLALLLATSTAMTLAAEADPEPADAPAEPTDAEPFENKPEWGEGEALSGDVQFVGDKHWANFRLQNPVMLAMFYAPWCGHCKAMKPSFAEASVQLKDDPFAFVAVDCTSDTGKETCAKFDVKGYPTVKYFDSADGEAQDYQGGRSKKDLIKFAKKKADPDWQPPPPEPWVNKPEWGDESHQVLFFGDDHAQQVRAKNPQLLVMFMAPWCGHCKALKPEFGLASERVGGSFALGAVDCTSNGQELCGKYGVKSYPTLYYFNTSTTDSPQLYDEGRDSGGLVTFAQRMVKKAAKAADAAAAKDAAGAEMSEASLKKLRVRALRALLKAKGVECAGCTEKHEFVKRVLETQSLKTVTSLEEQADANKENEKKDKKKGKKKRRTVSEQMKIFACLLYEKPCWSGTDLWF